MAATEAGASAPVPRRRFRRPDLSTPTLLGLPLAWLVVFFVVPIAIVAAYSFDVYSLFPGKHGFTFAAWREFVHSSVYLALFWKSVKISLTVSAIIVVLAYPLAYYLALSGTKRKYVLLLVLIAPFLTSYLLRVRNGAMSTDRKSTRLNSSHRCISYAVFCLKKKKKLR